MGNPVKNKNEEAVHAFDNKKWRYYELEFPKSAYAAAREALGKNVSNVNPLKVIERCPKCKRNGIPKIERKDANDRRLRIEKLGITNSNESNKSNDISKKRSDEYWITYDHALKPKKCRILKFESLHSTRNVIPNQKQKIVIEEFVYPYCVGFLKRQNTNK